ncbi:SDR family oxidoreductase (plasmid) [Pseudoalteromonas espejiana]
MALGVNCVRPGLINTQMHADGGEPERVERLKELIPLKRGGEPEEVAAIYWLSSAKSSFSTGNFRFMWWTLIHNKPM